MTKQHNIQRHTIDEEAVIDSLAHRNAPRRRKWDLETVSEIWNRPRYAGGGIGVTNDKGDNFYVEDDGTLVNERTGQRGSIGLDEVVVRPRTYASSFDGSLAGNMDVLNAMTGGVLNRLSLSQNARLLYDMANGRDWRSSWIGNNGIVSDNYAKEHPYLSMLANGVADAAPAGGIKTLSGLIKMRGRKLGYTGVPPQKVYNYEHNPNNDYPIWTTQSPQYAKKYTIGPNGKGKIYKVYGKSYNPLKVPNPENNAVMWWENMPLHTTKDGKVKLNSTLDYVRGKANTFRTESNPNVVYATPDRFIERIMKKIDPLFEGGISTNQVVDFAKNNGYDATIMKHIDDGAGIGNLDEIVDEVVYSPFADVIKAPMYERYITTAFKNGKTYGSQYTVPITTSNIHRNNKKHVGGSLIH